MQRCITSVNIKQLSQVESGFLQNVRIGLSSGTTQIYNTLGLRERSIQSDKCLFGEGFMTCDSCQPHNTTNKLPYDKILLVSALCNKKLLQTLDNSIPEQGHQKNTPIPNSSTFNGRCMHGLGQVYSHSECFLSCHDKSI